MKIPTDQAPPEAVVSHGNYSWGARPKGAVFIPKKDGQKTQ